MYNAQGPRASIETPTAKEVIVAKVSPLYADAKGLWGNSQPSFCGTHEVWARRRAGGLLGLPNFQVAPQFRSFSEGEVDPEAASRGYADKRPQWMESDRSRVA